MIFGIDYGSKLAGTTVITYNVEKTLYQKSSVKKENADAMILKSIIELQPTSIYLDAPLSIPKAYFGNGDDYFYREADKELKAMSPMFLGGLTARAMQLKVQIEGKGIDVFETYPSALVKSIPELKKAYRKKDVSSIPNLIKRVQKLVGDYKIKEQPTNMHQIDSLLAWFSGHRHQNGCAEIVGNKIEGVIIF